MFRRILFTALVVTTLVSGGCGFVKDSASGKPDVAARLSAPQGALNGNLCKARQDFTRMVAPMLESKCVSCHSSAPGGLSLMQGQEANNYLSARSRLKLDNQTALDQSLLFTKALGFNHGGGKLLASDEKAFADLRTWGLGELECLQSPPAMNGLEISPSSLSLQRGQSLALKATANYQDADHDVTAQAEWVSLSPAVVEISPTGLVKAVSSGSAVIRATFSGKTAEMTAMVLVPTVDSIEVSPAEISLIEGKTQQLTVRAKLSDGTSIEPTSDVDWSSSKLAQATVSSTGLVTAVGAGNAAISAKYKDKSGSASVVVVKKDEPVVLSSVEVTPGDPSSLRERFSKQLKLFGKYSDLTRKELTSGVTWTSSNAANLSVDASGKVKAHVGGKDVNVTGTFQGKSATVKFSTVKNICPSRPLFDDPVTVTKVINAKCTNCHSAGSGGYYGDYDGSRGRLKLGAGEKVADSMLLLKAVGIDHGGGKVLDTASTDYQQILLWASEEQICENLPPAVLTSVSISPTTLSLRKDEKSTLKVFGKYDDNSTVEIKSGITWTSADPTKVSVNAAGEVKGLVASTSVVTAKYSGKTATIKITVTAPTLKSIDVSPVSSKVKPGASLQLTATANYVNESPEDVTGRVTWTSSASNKATVSASGLVKALASGKANIIAAIGSIKGVHTVEVYVPTLQKITLTPAAVTVKAGELVSLKAIGQLSDGDTEDMTEKADWTVNSSTLAEVLARGVIRAKATGSLVVRAKLGSISGTSDVTILPPTVVSIELSPTVSVAKVGQQQPFSAVAKYSDASTKPLDSTAVWTSSNRTVAVLTPDHRAQAKAIGSSRIDAKQGSKTGSATFNVVSCPSKPKFTADVNPILKSKCLSCHSALDSFKLSSNADSNYTAAMNKVDMQHVDSSLLLRRPSGQNHAEVIAAGGAEYNLINQWILSEKTCASDTPIGDEGLTNLSRDSSLVTRLRLQALFPTAAGSMRLEDFSPLTAAGLERAIASPERPMGTAAQIALRNRVATLCRLPRGTGDAFQSVFSTQKILLRTETALPTDPIELLAFAAARNVWLSPYTVSSPQVQELIKLYKSEVAAAAAHGETPSVQQAQARQAVCMAAILSPSFWLGNPGGDDLVARVSLGIGHRIPLFTDYDDLRAAGANGRAGFLRRFVEKIQATDGYMDVVKSWHEEQLGLRDFVSDVSFVSQADGMGGANALAGAYFKYQTVEGLSRPSIKMSLPQGLFMNSMSSSETCEPKEQEFDPSTSKVIWEHFNRTNNTWEMIGSWEKTATGEWQMKDGRITLADKSTKVTTLADIVLADMWRPDPLNPGLPSHKGEFVYMSGGLVGTPLQYFVANERRVRRFSGQGVEQNGYSVVQLWHSGQPVYVCNGLSRYWSSCVYRPADFKQATYANWSAASPLPMMHMKDSMASPAVLADMRCGPPDAAEIVKVSGYNEDRAYPKGSIGNVNPLAMNIHLEGGAPQTIVADTEEAGSKVRLVKDMRKEPLALLEHILRTNRPYSELLTADYTIGGGELEQFYRSQGYFLPTMVPGYTVGNAAQRGVTRVISASSLNSIPLAMLRNSSGGYGIQQKKIVSNLQTQGLEVVPPRVMSGILTQNAFLGPVRPKIRSLSARIFTRLLCGLPDTIKLEGQAQRDLHMQLIPTTEAGGQQHVKGTCVSCHINLDPLAQALSSAWAPNVGKNAIAESWAELYPYAPYPVEPLMGVRNGGAAPNRGALFGEEVVGIEGVGRRLANSREWARCTVQTAFENIFGRPPTFGDTQMIDTVTNQFQLHYNYNTLIQDLIVSDPYQRSN